MKGEGHKWAILKDRSWDDYVFEAKFNLIEGGIHFNYRRSVSSGHQRYFIGVTKTNLHLSKQIGDKFYELASESLSLDDGWHKIAINGKEDILNVYLDEKLYLEIKDESPIMYGGIAFETLKNSICLVDDVEVRQTGNQGMPEGKLFKNLLPYISVAILIVIVVSWIFWRKSFRRNLTK